MNRRIILTIVKAVSGAIIIYLFHSSLEKKLLWLSDVLNDKTEKTILDASLWIILGLVILGFLLDILSLIDGDGHKKKKIQDNICQAVFEKYIEPNDHLCKEDIKISIMVKKQGLVFKKQFQPANLPYFQACGRYQMKQPIKSSGVKFLLNQGVVGLAYSQNKIIAHQIKSKYDVNKEEYLKYNEEKLNLPRWKVEKLNDKSYYYICIPIRQYHSHEVIAVMSIDSSEKINQTHLDPQAIGDYLKVFNPFFDHNRII